MQKIQRLWPHTKWYTDDEALSFVVDLEDMGVDPSELADHRHKTHTCEIYLVAGPESNPDSARPVRSHWIN